EDRLAGYLQDLNSNKSVVYCGDLNVALTEIDLKYAKSNVGNSGFTFEERAKFSELLASGFVDSFRYKHPNETDHFTWWSYMNKVRERNIGWRIDYFIVSEQLKNQIDQATIHPLIMG
uniref:exodeoxyribonuclease III n=1 Tax=Lysinibacillus sp. D4B1_S16 TaxID=2941231 RepID=UPI0020C08129